MKDTGTVATSASKSGYKSTLIRVRGVRGVPAVFRWCSGGVPGVQGVPFASLDRVAGLFATYDAKSGSSRNTRAGAYLQNASWAMLPRTAPCWKSGQVESMWLGSGAVGS